MRFHCEIKKVIENGFGLISYTVALIAVCSYFCFVYSCSLLINGMNELTIEAARLITLHTILNTFINILVWYLFIKINRNVRV